jgi:hypothetical protein
MSSTIEKRPAELRAGDIVNYDCGAFIILKIRNMSVEGSVDAYVVECNDIVPTVVLMTFTGTCYVTGPSMTPAQQNAEELLALVRNYGTVSLSSWECTALDLLARIDPPKPPSAEELAQVMEYLMLGRTNPPRAVEMLERARAAGCLKGGEK